MTVWDAYIIKKKRNQLLKAASLALLFFLIMANSVFQHARDWYEAHDTDNLTTGTYSGVRQTVHQVTVVGLDGEDYQLNLYDSIGEDYKVGEQLKGYEFKGTFYLYGLGFQPLWFAAFIAVVFALCTAVLLVGALGHHLDAIDVNSKRKRKE